MLAMRCCGHLSRKDALRLRQLGRAGLLSISTCLAGALALLGIAWDLSAAEGGGGWDSWEVSAPFAPSLVLAIKRLYQVLPKR